MIRFLLAGAAALVLAACSPAERNAFLDAAKPFAGAAVKAGAVYATGAIDGLCFGQDGSLQREGC